MLILGVAVKEYIVDRDRDNDLEYVGEPDSHAVQYAVVGFTVRDNVARLLVAIGVIDFEYVGVGVLDDVLFILGVLNWVNVGLNETECDTEDVIECELFWLVGIGDQDCVFVLDWLTTGVWVYMLVAEGEWLYWGLSVLVEVINAEDVYVIIGDTLWVYDEIGVLLGISRPEGVYVLIDDEHWL